VGAFGLSRLLISYFLFYFIIIFIPHHFLRQQWQLLPEPPSRQESVGPLHLAVESKRNRTFQTSYGSADRGESPRAYYTCYLLFFCSIKHGFFVVVVVVVVIIAWLQCSGGAVCDSPATSTNG
jgi:hypothetical protein